MFHSPLDRGDDLAGVALEPEPVEFLRDDAELHEEIVGQVLWFSLAALLPPEANKGGLVGSHNDPSVRAADEGATVGSFTINAGKRRVRGHEHLPMTNAHVLLAQVGDL